MVVFDLTWGFVFFIVLFHLAFAGLIYFEEGLMMKRRMAKSKLSLRKRTVANLTEVSMGLVKGGFDVSTYTPASCDPTNCNTCDPSCPVTCNCPPTETVGCLTGSECYCTLPPG